MDFLTANLQSTLHWVQTNPLIVTLMSGGAVVWLFGNIRNIWHTIVNTIDVLISFTIFNTYEDNRGTYDNNSLRIRQTIFNSFLTNSKTIWERTVNLDLNDNTCLGYAPKLHALESTLDNKNAEIDSYDMAREKASVNTYGFSIKIIFGKLCFINRGYKQDGMKIIVNTTVKVFFARKKKFMEKLDRYIKETQLAIFNAEMKTDYVSVYANDTYTGLKHKRSISTIFTDGDVHLELFEDIKKFINNKEIYKKLNYPYNYCALLHGVPGSGKTSTLLAIASELNKNIKYINLSTMSTQKLISALNSYIDNSIFVFEDVDCIATRGASKRSDNEESDQLSDSDVLLKTLTLSDLLNITDGLLASDGAICLFTTNYINKLDSAFLRAGRMNKIVEYTYLSSSTANKMIKTYLGHEVDGLVDVIKPAELQEMLLMILTGKKTEEDLKAEFCKAA